MRDPLARAEAGIADLLTLVRSCATAHPNMQEQVNAAIAKARGVMAGMNLGFDLNSNQGFQLFEALEDLIGDVQKALNGAENKIDGAVEALNGIGSVV